MGSADFKATFAAAEPAAKRRALRSLYEDALREVISDPRAAVLKYQPGWLAALSSGPGSGSPSRDASSDEKPSRGSTGRKA